MKILAPDFRRTMEWLHKLKKIEIQRILNKYGKLGVEELSKLTPVDTGETKKSWSYYIEQSGDSYKLIWKNSVMAGDTPLVILIQYGHGTGTGGYVEGKDIVNPAIKPLYEKILQDIGKEVRKR